VRHQSGFTVIESTIVIALIAALTAITVPRAVQFIDGIEVRGAVTEIESMFSLARHTAIARGSQIALDIDLPARSMSIRSGTELLRTRDVGAGCGVENHEILVVLDQLGEIGERHVGSRPGVVEPPVRVPFDRDRFVDARHQD